MHRNVERRYGLPNDERHQWHGINSAQGWKHHKDEDRQSVKIEEDQVAKQ